MKKIRFYIISSVLFLSLFIIVAFGKKNNPPPVTLRKAHYSVGFDQPTGNNRNTNPNNLDFKCGNIQFMYDVLFVNDLIYNTQHFGTENCRPDVLNPDRLSNCWQGLMSVQTTNSGNYVRTYDLSKAWTYSSSELSFGGDSRISIAIPQNEECRVSFILWEPCFTNNCARRPITNPRSVWRIDIIVPPGTQDVGNYGLLTNAQLFEAWTISTDGFCR